ncbi:hypothetical protein OQ968_02150 [Mycobacterium sp. 663a-19]|uniref:hypothetical protein n=1 Tax=Mycobacterium sp. 663a-19 TaxID=2986148 RepID=UPI002D1F472A|nr:hypothetical protein [Mycobacterium sp. 663a-19]MEB3980060.1 hypothetical protein [Mycobacterium sp. 663a-19]
MAAATVLGCGAAPLAGATVCDPPINGIYTAIADGQWAQTNDTYHNEKTVTSTWTIGSTCSDFIDCTGRVASSQGWSADATCQSGLWKVRRHLDNWEPCRDGTAAPGDQTYAFSPDMTNDANFVGWTKTVGPSGACGVNQWLAIKMPFRLIKIG